MQNAQEASYSVNLRQRSHRVGSAKVHLGTNQAMFCPAYLTKKTQGHSFHVEVVFVRLFFTCYCVQTRRCNTRHGQNPSHADISPNITPYSSDSISSRARGADLCITIHVRQRTSCCFFKLGVAPANLVLSRREKMSSSGFEPASKFDSTRKAYLQHLLSRSVS